MIKSIIGLKIVERGEMPRAGTIAGADYWGPTASMLFVDSICGRMSHLVAGNQRASRRSAVAERIGVAVECRRAAEMGVEDA
jgi:hypothetical protein